MAKKIFPGSTSPYMIDYCKYNFVDLTSHLVNRNKIRMKARRAN